MIDQGLAALAAFPAPIDDVIFWLCIDFFVAQHLRQVLDRLVEQLALMLGKQAPALLEQNVEDQLLLTVTEQHVVSPAVYLIFSS